MFLSLKGCKCAVLSQAGRQEVFSHLTGSGPEALISEDAGSSLGHTGVGGVGGALLIAGKF